MIAYMSAIDYNQMKQLLLDNERADYFVAKSKNGYDHLRRLLTALRIIENQGK